MEIKEKNKNIDLSNVDIALVGDRFIVGKEYLSNYEKEKLISMGINPRELINLNPRNVIIDKKRGIELSIRGIDNYGSEKELLYKMHRTMIEFLVDYGYRCVYDELKKYYDILEIEIDNILYSNKKDICYTFKSCLECPLFTNEPIHEVISKFRWNEEIIRYEDIDEENFGGVI